MFLMLNSGESEGKLRAEEEETTDCARNAICVETRLVRFVDERRIPEEQHRRTDVLEASSFSSLPESLVEKILAFLPLFDIFNTKSVCKLWNSLVKSAEFSALWRETTAASPWILLRGKVCENSHRSGSLIEHVCCRPSSPTDRRFSFNLPYGLKVLAACRGLVCAVRKPVYSALRLMVGNPITQKWKELPPVSLGSPPPILFRPIVAMVVDPPSDAYIVVIFLNYPVPPEKAIFAIYHSNTGSWQRNSAVIPGTRLPLTCRDFIRIGPSADRPMLLVYDTDRCLWSEVTFLPPSSDEWTINFDSGPFLYMGRYMLVAVLTGAHDVWEFGVFQLEEESTTWKLQTTATWDWCYGEDWQLHEERYSFECRHFQAFEWKSQENMVVVSIRGSFCGRRPPVACNLEDLSWHVLLQDFHPQYKYKCQCVFIPSLHEEP